MIPLSWRFFVSVRDKLGYSDLWGEELATHYHPKTNFPFMYFFILR